MQVLLGDLTGESFAPTDRLHRMVELCSRHGYGGQGLRHMIPREDLRGLVDAVAALVVIGVALSGLAPAKLRVAES